MQHFMNIETEAVDTLDDSADPAVSFLDPDKWVPVHVHLNSEIPLEMRYVGAGRFEPTIKSAPARKPPLGRIIAHLTVGLFSLALLAFAGGIAVFALQFVVGLFS